MKKIVTLASLLLICVNVNFVWANAADNKLRIAPDMQIPIDQADTILDPGGFIFTATDGTVYGNEDVRLENNGVEAVFADTGAPFSGVARYVSNEAPVAETPYAKGLAHGSVKTYHANGVVARTIPYNNGKIEGLVKVYSDKGRIVDEISYVNDIIEGKWKHFDAATNSWTIDVYKNGEKVSTK